MNTGKIPGHRIECYNERHRDKGARARRAGVTGVQETEEISRVLVGARCPPDMEPAFEGGFQPGRLCRHEDQRGKHPWDQSHLTCTGAARSGRPAIVFPTRRI